jgi:hypothetical protein
MLKEVFPIAVGPIIVMRYFGFRFTGFLAPIAVEILVEKRRDWNG